MTGIKFLPVSPTKCRSHTRAVGNVVGLLTVRSRPFGGGGRAGVSRKGVAGIETIV
jgi:hypothetical protein